jgi:Flp pilus assembly protein TadD
VLASALRSDRPREALFGVAAVASRTDQRRHSCDHPTMLQRSDDQLDDADRESAYALLQRGLALIRSRHHAQAAIVLQRASREEPGKGSILEPLGRAYHHSGQFELARQTFEALLDVDPSAHWAHFALAASLRKLDRIAEARTHLRLAVALCPNSAMYRQALAKVDPPA